jgi:hypothetical protein
MIIAACLAAGLAGPAAASAAPAKPAARAARAARTAPRDSTAAAAHRAAAAARTLDEIHIEGEIPVPQVLFITARDQRRFMEFQHRRYLRTSRTLGAATALPSRIVVTPASPTPERRHSDE